MSFTLTRLDDRPLPDNRAEIRALIVARNERLRLTWLLQYYRELGVDRFLVVDNDSDDGSVEFLLAQPDVHVWHTRDSYGSSKYGRYWLDRIRASHGYGHWCLVVDADEVLVYPLSEFVNLRQLVSYMEKHGQRGLFTFMLDMYPVGSLANADLQEGQNFLEVADHFDIGPYFVMPAETFPHLGLNGGLRRRIFFRSGLEGRGPNLRKVPLIRWQEGDEYTSAHSCTELPLSDITGILLHFKYFSDFHKKAEIESLRGEHAHLGREYAIYLDLLSQSPDVSFASELSRKYVSTLEMIRIQLLFCSAQYLAYLESSAQMEPLELEQIQAARALVRRFDTDLRLPYSAINKIWRILA